MEVKTSRAFLVIPAVFDLVAIYILKYISFLRL